MQAVIVPQTGDVTVAMSGEEAARLQMELSLLSGEMTNAVLEALGRAEEELTY